MGSTCAAGGQTLIERMSEISIFFFGNKKVLNQFLQMGSSSQSADRLFSRQRTVHQIFGGGTVADVILWRQKHLTVRVLLITLSLWLMFERSGYTLLSLTSSVLLLLMTILFVWAKAAALINRPAPPVPDLYLSEEMMDQVAAFVRVHVNSMLSISQDIVMGRESGLYFRVAGCLLLITLIGGFADFITLGYLSIIVILTIPAMYERYEDLIDSSLLWGYRSLMRLHFTVDQYIGMLRNLELEKTKLD